MRLGPDVHAVWRRDDPLKGGQQRAVEAPRLEVFVPQWDAPQLLQPKISRHRKQCGNEEEEKEIHGSLLVEAG
jgi:hypothetical protein